MPLNSRNASLSQDPPRSLGRREFMQRLGEAAAGSGLIMAAFTGCTLTPSQTAEAREAAVARMGQPPRRDLGPRLGHMKIAPIAICQDWSRDLYAPALAAGLNFVHKAGYWGEMPDEFKKRPRESYYADITVDSTPNNPDDEDRAYNQVAESLQRNGLRYYDIFRAHFGWKSVEAMRTQRGTRRAFERLKREGKVRYFGVSQHDYRPYPEMIGAEIEDGLLDSIQMFYSYGSPKEVTEICDKAHRAGVVMNAMKVYNNGHDQMQGDAARQAELKASGMIGRACLRHVLSLKGSDNKPIFGYCVTQLRNFTQFEDNVGAISQKVARADGFELIG